MSVVLNVSGRTVLARLRGGWLAVYRPSRRGVRGCGVITEGACP
ncbi:MAG: hypothetical protein QXW88_03890 [Thermofilum sp.]